MSREPPHGHHAQDRPADCTQADVSTRRAPGSVAYSHVFLALNTFWMLGSRSVGPPVGLPGSGTKCGFSDASHLCCSAPVAVGRNEGSTVRHSFTKSRAVSETFAQYSTERPKVSKNDPKWKGGTYRARTCSRGGGWPAFPAVGCLCRTACSRRGGSR